MLNLKKNIVIPITLVIIALGSLWYFLGEHEGIPDVKHQATSEQKGDDSDLVEQKKYALNKAVDSIDGKNDSDSGFKSENNHISSIDRVDSIFDNHKLLLELAREGDSLSQYRLYKMLAQCEWDFKPSEYDVESTIDRLVLNGYDPCLQK